LDRQLDEQLKKLQEKTKEQEEIKKKYEEELEKNRILIAELLAKLKKDNN